MMNKKLLDRLYPKTILKLDLDPVFMWNCEKMFLDCRMDSYAEYENRKMALLLIGKKDNPKIWPKKQFPAWDKSGIM